MSTTEKILTSFREALDAAPAYGRVTFEVTFKDGEPKLVHVNAQHSIALNAPIPSRSVPQFSSQGIRRL